MTDIVESTEEFLIRRLKKSNERIKELGSALIASKQEIKRKLKDASREVSKLQKALDVLRESNSFYADKENWHYGKSWSEGDLLNPSNGLNRKKGAAVGFHAIADEIDPHYLDVELNKICEKAYPLKPCDVELMPDKVKLLGRDYSYFCGGKKARQAKKQVKEILGE